MTKTWTDQISELGITMRVQKVGNNPNMIDPDGMDHWQCTLKSTVTDKKMVTFYSMSSGHKGMQPSLDNVLDCLALEAAGYDSTRNFEEWASDYGYDTDSRKAERIYNKIGNASERLKLFAQEHYASFLYETERL